MMTSYYPDDIPGQISWWSNLQVEGPALLAEVGLNPGEVSDVISDANWSVYLLQSARAQAVSFASMVHGFIETAFTAPVSSMTLLAWPDWSPAPPNNPLRSGIDARRVSWVKRVTGAPQYTPEVIGAGLRLIPTGTPFDPNTYQGEIVTAQATAHEKVKFVVRLAKGNIDGGNLYMERAGDVQPNLVRFSSQRTFADMTPLKVANVPEVRTYTYWPVIKDEQIGACSQATPVTVS